MEFRAGTARLSLEPPLGLPMVGFIRQSLPAMEYGRWPLETSAIAFEADGARVVLCGVDIVGIGEPEISQLIDRVAAAVDADPAGVILNWNHTHLAPLGGSWGGEVVGEPEPERDARVRACADVIQDKIVSVCRLAMSRLEPARVVWGVGQVDLAVNRRERSEGTTILGWNPDNMVDNEVTILQARRPDDSVIGSAVVLRLPPGDDRLRRLCLLGRLPRADARSRPPRPPAGSACSSRPRGATCSHASPSPRTSARPSAWAPGSPSRPCTPLPTGAPGPCGCSTNTRAR